MKQGQQLYLLDLEIGAFGHNMPERMNGRKGGSDPSVASAIAAHNSSLTIWRWLKRKKKDTHIRDISADSNI